MLQDDMCLLAIFFFYCTSANLLLVLSSDRDMARLSSLSYVTIDDSLSFKRLNLLSAVAVRDFRKALARCHWRRVGLNHCSKGFR